MDELQLLSELYEEAPCGYLSTQPDGTITRVNRTFEQLVGRAREELLGTRFSDLLTPGGRIYHETHYAPLLSMQGEVREIALELTRADGSVLPVLVNALAGGDVVRTTIFDATDRRRYEKELMTERRRAEALSLRASLLSEAGRAMAEVPGLSDRAQRLAEFLVGGTAEAATVVTVEPRSLIAAAGPRADDPRLAAAVDAALSSAAPQTAGPIAAVPLLTGAQVIGAVGVGRFHHVDGFGAEDIALLEAIADRAALALENARLYEYEREVAHTLQRSMLAGAPPHHARCAVGTYYAPAVDTLEVGGDWHDAFFLGEDRLAIVVGDVVGRGLDAATTMGQLRSAVRALAGAGLGPAGVLEALDAFVERTGDGRGATVAYAEFDLQNGVLALACAGHPPPVVARPGAEPELLWGGRSAPLGAYAGPYERSSCEETLTPGSRLLLYTDGLVERRDEPLDQGIAKLVAAFGATEGVSVADLGTTLLAGMHTEGAGKDDVCVLALAFGSGDPFERRLEAEPGRLRTLRADLTSWLEARGVGPADRDAVVLACSETAANAIEHAYVNSHGHVCIVADTVPGEVTLAVRDRGAWRMPGTHGRGRGLKIVEHVMDEVVLDRGRGTRVTMRRRLREPRNA